MNARRFTLGSALCLPVLLGSVLLASPVAAQVFDVGPSDSTLFDNVINIPPDPSIGSSANIGGDGLTTQLNISGSGSVGSGFNADAGSEVNISGGSLGSGFNSNSGSEINISGGVVGDNFEANSGSVVNISSGTVGEEFEAFVGSVINISGGNLGDGFDAESGSVVNISGGSFGTEFDAFSDSQISISGGNFGTQFEAFDGTFIDLIGGEFQLNGAAFSAPSILIGAGDVFTGTFADGSTFVFANEASDFISNVLLVSETLPTVDLSPIVVTTPNPNLPSGLRTGQTLTLQTGGVLGNNFEAVDATLNVEGGVLGNGGGASNSVVTISGGAVGDDFDALAGSVVNINDGSVGSDFDAFSGSEINISGGSVGSSFDAFAGSEVNIDGGSLGINFQANEDSVVNLFGSDFLLDGVLLDGDLTSGSALTIFERDVTLSGLLADGSAFSFDLNSVDTDPNAFPIPGITGFEDFFSPDATLTVTLVSAVPEPSSLTMIGLSGLMLLSRRRKS